MTLAIVYSRASSGITAPLVTVEVHISPGMAGLNIVGLPETAVKESKDRVRSAIINSHFEFPARRITINLAPADLPKEGGRFDLPIALGILAASRQIPHTHLNGCEIIGELALSGELRAVRGILPVVLAAYLEKRRLIVPQMNAAEAAFIPQAQTVFATHLLDVCAYLKNEKDLPSCQPDLLAPSVSSLDISDVKGQGHAKRALEIAAAGKHSLFFIGPPGTGKTMLASRLSSLLPELDDQEALEAAAIASVSSSGFTPKNWKQIPFRSPHHSSSNVALVGGGRPPKPGEVSLAHHGILFLDELPEFNRHVLESLREPLESGSVTISRAAYQTFFPAQFQFVAAMNPCPCGYAGSRVTECTCSADQIKRYLNKISGPLLDRIDMTIEVPHLAPEQLYDRENETREHSAAVRQRVIKARAYQWQRQGKYNFALSVSEIDNRGNIQPSAQRLLGQIMAKFNFSARTYYRVLKVARTIADLEQTPWVEDQHISETLQYRCFDKLKRLTG